MESAKNTEETKEKEEKKSKEFYDEEVRKYMRLNIEDKEYNELISKNPNDLFSSVDTFKVVNIELNLYRSMSPSGKGVDESILSVELNRKDQSVIQNDCKRTRVRESVIFENYKETLEKILTYYCNIKNIIYKQGLNEIFGPLLLLKCKFPTLKFSKIFDIGEAFIDKYLPNYYYEKEFFSLKCSLDLFIILLRYHEPSVYNRLDSLDLTPETYATNWVMTLFISKLRLTLVYDYLDEIVKTGDSLFFHFMLVSLIKLKRELIINCQKSLVAGLMTSLTIQSLEEIKLIVEMATELRQQTPYSFRILANKMGFLQTNNKNLKENYEKYRARDIPAMPFFPSEILYMDNKNNEIKCFNPDCKSEKKSNSTILNFHNAKYIPVCEKCDMKIEKKINYILLDMRILQYDEKEEDDNDLDEELFLRNLIRIDQDELKSEEFSRIITERFIEERGLHNFIFITSSTNTYSEFDNYYSDIISEEDKLKTMYGILLQNKIEKGLNLDEAKNKNLTQKKWYELKEYDNLRKTLNLMQKENFPYIGYVYGGFNAIQEEKKTYVQEEEKCSSQEENKKVKKDKKTEKKNKKINNKELIHQLWATEKRIKFEELNALLKNPKNFVCLCTVNEYRQNKVNYNASIALIDQKYTIIIYKFLQRKIYVEKNKENIEQKIKNWNYYELGKDTNDNSDIELTILEEIKIYHILEIIQEQKNKNIVTIKAAEEIKDKKLIKKKGVNYTEYSIKVDFPSIHESKKFASTFKEMAKNYKTNIKKSHK